MITIKTAEATGAALDWLVAVAEGKRPYKDATLNGVSMSGWWFSGFHENPNVWTYTHSIDYSTDWSQAGPIIDRERIATLAPPTEDFWDARKAGLSIPAVYYRGPTLLIAAMRCYVCSKLGESVEVPKELMP